jgi:hypothetical protein
MFRKTYDIKTKLLILVFLLICVTIQIKAENQTEQHQKGITTEVSNNPSEVGSALEYQMSEIKVGQSLPGIEQFLKNVAVEELLDLYIPPGKYAAVKFNHLTKAIELIQAQTDNEFSSTVEAAMEKSPRWLKNDLINVFSKLDNENSEKWAATILDTDDPFIDEVAFTIAHLSPQYLMSSYVYPELVKKNAELIYEYDPVLQYVDVVDYGSSDSDPDYYTTTKYRKANYLDTVEVEVPREIYYWYIVHPKITDEIPAYVDPDIAEYSHRENLTDPDHGFFWRDFLFNHADAGYALFKNMIKQCKVVWNKFEPPAGFDPHALDIMNRWLDAAIVFTSENDRPHQPIRIYRKHMGRCGEFGDMRVALSRTALIPAANVASYARDHVWNEFWDERWIHWDGTIDDPLMYVDDWGKLFNTVFKWKSDGSFSSVTDTYTRDCSILNIYALDSLSNPVDGAKVLLYGPGLYEARAFDNYAITDASGKATFTIAADRTYWARVESDLGNVPSSYGQVVRVISMSGKDQVYNNSIKIPNQKEEINCQEIQTPQVADGRFYLNINIKSPDQIIYGSDLFDDLNVNATMFTANSTGYTDFFMVDEYNYFKYLNGEQFQAFNIISDSLVKAGFEFNADSDWYGVFNNKYAMNTYQHIEGTVQLYKMYDENISDVRIMPNFPNPLVQQANGTTIVYQLPQKTKVELSIFNVLGQKVRTLMAAEQYAGEFNINWDGKNSFDQFVASGIYFCKIKTAQGVASRKIIVMQ